MTAHPDERNCDCHWGSQEELSLLKTPDVELDPGLLRRTRQAIDWSDHPAVLRRILPQFARVLVAGQADPPFGLEEAGYSFARGRWQQRPDDHAGPVREFLHGWWEQSLTDPDAAVPAHRSSRCAPRPPERRAELASWLLDHAAVRLRESGAPADLQHRIRLLGLARPLACRLGEADRASHRPASGRSGR
jgi:hypothetical protein